MKALYLTRHFKEASEIVLPISEQPRPQIKKGECLVEVHASGVNPSDALGTIGYFPHAVLPRIPGRDFSGTIVEGSPNLIGKKVWGTGGTAGLESNGTHAEFLALPEAALAEIPKNLSLLQAGIQTLPYVTAYYSLVTRGRIEPDQSILVIGALGQVGHAAMSICSWKKCKPIALVRGADNVKKAKALGWTTVENVPSQPFDLILNTVGNVYWNELIQALKKFGRMAVIAAPEGKRDVQLNLLDFYRENRELIGINTVDLNFIQNAKLLNEMKPGFESGMLKPLTCDQDSIFPLEKAEFAYKMVLTKSTGKRICLQML